MKHITSYILILTILLFSCKISNRPKYEIKYVNKAVKIDGVIDSVWLYANVDSLRNVTIGEYNRKNRSDLSGNFEMLWDNYNIYILFVIKDNIKVGIKDLIHSISHEMDGIQLFLDMNKRKWDDPLCQDHLTYPFIYGTDTLIDGEKIPLMGIEFKQQDSQDGYIFEIKMPWETIGFKPIINKTFSCEIHLIDCDDDRYKKEGFFEGRETVMAWSEQNTDKASFTALVYGDMKLIK